MADKYEDKYIEELSTDIAVMFHRRLVNYIQKSAGIGSHFSVWDDYVDKLYMGRVKHVMSLRVNDVSVFHDNIRGDDGKDALARQGFKLKRGYEARFEYAYTRKS